MTVYTSTLIILPLFFFKQLEVVGPGGPPDGHGDDDHHWLHPSIKSGINSGKMERHCLAYTLAFQNPVA